MLRSKLIYLSVCLMLAVSGPVYKCGQNPENNVGVCASYRSVSGYQGAQFVIAHYKKGLIQDDVQIGTLLVRNSIL